MTNETDLLFQPLRVKSHRLKNRLVFPPAASVTGVVTPRGLAWYERIASGGVGTVIVEGTSLARFAEPGFADGLAELASTLHRHGVRAIIQLFSPPHSVDGEPVSVSGTADARAATTEEVVQLPADYAAAATVARDAGFDGVEPHGAHGFFLNQFFSPLSNTRSDAYGGSRQNRMRLGIETVTAVRAALGDDPLLFYRHTPEQATPGGYGIEESREFARHLDDAGVDVLDVSPSTRGVTPREKGRPDAVEHAGLAEALRDAVGCAIMAVGGMEDPAAAQAVLARGKVALLGICRGLIADAEWPQKIAEGRETDIVRCTKCNEKCFGNLSRGVPIACTQWPG